MKRILSIALLIMVAAALAACGGAAGGGGGGGAPTLDQTYNANGLSFKYPSGWVTDGESGVVLLASSQEALTSATDTTDIPTLAAGQMAITIIPFGADIASAMQTTGPVDLLQQMTQQTATEEQSFQDATEATIAGHPAARAVGSSATMDSQFVAINLGDSGYVILGGVAPKGDLSKVEATVNAIAETIVVTPVSE